MGSRRAQSAGVRMVTSCRRKPTWSAAQKLAAQQKHIGLELSSLDSRIREFEKKLYPGKYRHLIQADKEKQT